MRRNRSEPDDRALVLACRQGDAGAWETLIRRYRRLVYSIPFAYRMSAQQADDVFQRVAVQLLQNIGNLRNPDKIASWLIVTTRRACYALTRETARFEPIDDAVTETHGVDPPDVVASIEAVASQHALALALERLSGSCRDLLAALYLEDPTPAYDVIARRLGRPVGSLGPTRRRCLDKLKKLYLDAGGSSL